MKGPETARFPDRLREKRQVMLDVRRRIGCVFFGHFAVFYFHVPSCTFPSRSLLYGAPTDQSRIRIAACVTSTVTTNAAKKTAWTTSAYIVRTSQSWTTISKILIASARKAVTTVPAAEAG